MTRIKVLGLALVAVFAMAAMTAGSASAANPVFLECAKAAKEGKTYLGHHNSKTCNDAYIATGGKYELKIGVGKGKAFKSSGSKAVLHSVNPEAKVDIPVECASFKGSGEEKAPSTLLNVKTTFSKCKALGAECKNVKKETIETKTLAGSLGWISKPGKVVGTDLVNQASPGSYEAEFTCSALGEIRTAGSVIGQNAGNIGVINKESELIFAPKEYLGEICSETEKGTVCWKPIVNIPEFEGGSPDILKTEVKGSITGHPGEFYPEGGIPSGQEGVSKQKGEAVEIAEEGTV